MHHEPTELPRGSGSGRERSRTPPPALTPEGTQHQNDLKLFGLRDADKAELLGMVKHMYKYLGKTNHPDKAPAGKEDEFKVKMQEINNANERLLKHCELA